MWTGRYLGGHVTECEHELILLGILLSVNMKVTCWTCYWMWTWRYIAGHLTECGQEGILEDMLLNVNRKVSWRTCYWMWTGRYLGGHVTECKQEGILLDMLLNVNRKVSCWTTLIFKNKAFVKHLEGTKMKQNILRQTQLSYILLISIVATSFGLRRPSCQNIYKNLKAGVYNVLFVSVMGYHSQSYNSL